MMMLCVYAPIACTTIQDQSCLRARAAASPCDDDLAPRELSEVRPQEECDEVDGSSWFKKV